MNLIFKPFIARIITSTVASSMFATANSSMDRRLLLPHSYRIHGRPFQNMITLIEVRGERHRACAHLPCVRARRLPSGAGASVSAHVTAPWWNVQKNQSCQRDVKTSAVLGNCDPCHGIPTHTSTHCTHTRPRRDNKNLTPNSVVTEL